MMPIYAVSIADFSDDYIPHLLSFVAEDKKQRLGAFFRREDRVRGLLADLLIRKIAAETFAVSAKSISFGTNAYGKPSLQGPLNRLHYNLSHSGDWVVCITGDCTVGIDIEKKHQIDLQIARQFFAPEEYEYIEEEPDSERRQARFFAVWTAKESYIKAIGKGLSLPLNSFSTVSQGTVEGARVFEQARWHFKTYFLDDEYTLTACAPNDSFCETVEIVPMDTLVSYFLSR
ncbi:4'-phosphopantetheinyl transferase family protein [Brevibacillus parabrevis]|uniref:4'-phosphopantetheinyl transferase n=1 Tax=Brevibacillus parabrevis TaxID=54914 RepID=A0A4Y3PN78_BREPA|nr:4'-phosphopantetheinyl transferase superfamily protein [Brevibacillus parabrevis]RNB92781.1 4'-phosphopantetheinyl transferase superfamily protein [Brevibacillus parabrevis]GEB34853.1 4'-phosphopantetheinyl transferase [Brevibacillus parabrevis]